MDKNAMVGGLYKLAKIFDAGGDMSRPWFVYFYHRKSVQDKFERIRLYANINSFKEKDVRRETARLLRDTINEALKKGDLTNLPVDQAPEPEFDGEYYNVVSALRKVMDARVATMKKRSAGTYLSAFNLFLKWLKKTGYDALPTTQLRGRVLQQYQTYMASLGLSATTINSRMENVGYLFKRLVKLEVIDKNPYDAIDPIKETETSVFEAYTNDEINTIAEHLKEVSPELFLFWLHIYYCFLRPETIVQLKRSDYDFAEKKIYISGEIHKNRKKAVKQMLEPLFDYLVAAGVDKLPFDHLVFSKDLKPGTQKIAPTRAAERWKKLIIDGLKINKKLYAAKHTGGIDYITSNAGAEDVNWLQQQMSHHSISETQTYIKNRQVKMLDETKANIKKI
ncbi:MAG: phage integrase SAM-like domain-containing protein [Bacteroidota bacterium]